MVARRAHNPKVVRSSRALATKKRVVSFGNSFLFYTILKFARRSHISQRTDVRSSRALATRKPLELPTAFLFNNFKNL